MQAGVDTAFPRTGVNPYPRFQEVKSELRMTEFVLGDESTDLRQNWLLCLARGAQKKISREVLTDHVAGKFREWVRNHVSQVSLAHRDEFLVAYWPVVHQVQVSV